MTIGDKLRDARGSKTQEEVAKAIGISTSALGMYETDQRVPRDEIKIRLADYYDLGLVELFFDPLRHETRQSEENTDELQN